MKFNRLLIVCVLCLCFGCSTDSKQESNPYPELHGYDKQYDFSTIDKTGLSIEHAIKLPDKYDILYGYKDRLYRWYGVFDNKTYQPCYNLTDMQRPFTHSVYGEEHQYEYATPDPYRHLSVLDNYLAVAIPYILGDTDYCQINLAISDKKGALATYLTLSTDLTYSFSIDVANMVYLSKWYNDMLYVSVVNQNHTLESQMNEFIFDIPTQKKLYNHNYTSRLEPTNRDVQILPYVLSECCVLSLSDFSFWCCYQVTNNKILIRKYKNSAFDRDEIISVFEDSSNDCRYKTEYQKQDADEHIFTVTKTSIDGIVDVKKVKISMREGDLNVSIE